MNISIIIVSYNTKEILVECLKSILKAQDTIQKEIIVVDNTSTDGTQSFLAQYFPQIKLIQNQKNVGFGIANNQGAQVATGEYLLFLNSDTLIVQNSLSHWLELVKLKHALISSCRLLYSDGQNIQPQGGGLPSIFNTFAWMTFLDDIPVIKHIFNPYQQSNPKYFESDRKMDWLSGTALMIKSDCFQKLGGFDPNIFMYGEDVELCLRAHHQKIARHYFTAPSIIHLGQASSQSENAILGEYTGLKYIFQKHKPAWQLSILRFWLKIGALLRILVFGIMQDDARKIAYKKAYTLA